MKWKHAAKVNLWRKSQRYKGKRRSIVLISGICQFLLYDFSLFSLLFFSVLDQNVDAMGLGDSSARLLLLG